MAPRFPHVAAVLAALAVGGCMPKGDYPSLAERPFEHGTAEPAATAPVPAAASPDPALVTHLAELDRASIATDHSFATQVPRTTKAVSAAGAVGGEGWIAAQQLVSALDALRASDTAALGELDATSRSLEATDDPRASAGLQAVAAEVATIRTRDDGHQRVIEALGRSLAS